MPETALPSLERQAAALCRLWRGRRHEARAALPRLAAARWGVRSGLSQCTRLGTRRGTRTTCGEARARCAACPRATPPSSSSPRRLPPLDGRPRRQPRVRCGTRCGRLCRARSSRGRARPTRRRTRRNGRSAAKVQEDEGFTRQHDEGWTCGGNHDVINGKHEADSQSMVINLTPKTPRPGIRMLCSTSSWKLEDPWTLPLIHQYFSTTIPCRALAT